MKLKGKGISVLLISIMLFSMIGSSVYAINSSTTNSDDESNIIYVSTYGNDSWNGLATEYDNKTGNGPKKTIKSALGAVDYDGTIKLAPGIYHENGINIDNSVKIKGSGADKTIIDGKRGQIFNIIADDEVNIQDLSMVNGQSRTKGSAIYNSAQCELTIENCNFKNNYRMGAIENNGVVIIDNCNFEQNRAQWGGAIKNYGDMTIKNSDFNSNWATYTGGAIYTSDNLQIDNCEFNYNYAGTEENQDDESRGGAIFNNVGSLDIKRSELSNNGAHNGGAIYSGSDYGICSSLYLEECKFESNSAEHGGAIYTMDNYRVIENNRFSYNNANEFGGAIATSSAESISNNRFKENQPEDIKILDMNMV